MNVLTITQGNTESPTFRLKYDGQPITASDVKQLEFTFGTMVKKYPEDAEYDSELKAFRVNLSQKDTFALPTTTHRCQIRIRFNDNKVKATVVFPMMVNPSISKVVLI